MSLEPEKPLGNRVEKGRKPSILQRAEDPEAPIAFLTAARQSMLEYRFEAALDLASRGLRLARHAEIQFDLACMRGDILREVGAIGDSLAAFENALPLLKDDSKRYRARIGIAAALSAWDPGSFSPRRSMCSRLCREHGYGRIEVANLAMRGWTRFYQNELADTCEDLARAAEIAERVADQRAALGPPRLEHKVDAASGAVSRQRPLW